MSLGLIGTKIGMSRMFFENGTTVPVTLVKIDENLKITQIKSSIGYRQRTKDTLKALGLKKINHSVIKDANDAVLGMTKHVSHLISVEEEKWI